MGITSIDWADYSWNPMTGCTKVSSGCLNCYAEGIALWQQQDGNPKYSRGFTPTMHPQCLGVPKKWKKGGIVFTVSMGDLYHTDIPLWYVQQVFDVARQVPQHKYVILTKRSERLVELSPHLPWHRNIWQGVTVEDQGKLFRLDHLRTVDTRVRVVSFEPLTSRIPDLDLTGIGWVIVGGEHVFGNDKSLARPMRKEWVQEIRDKCVANKVPFFFKQWSDANPEEEGYLLDDKIWTQYPRARYEDDEQTRHFL